MPVARASSGKNGVGKTFYVVKFSGSLGDRPVDHDSHTEICQLASSSAPSEELNIELNVDKQRL